MSRPIVGASFLAVTVALASATAQQFGNPQRDTGRQMLRDVADGVRKNYYDAKFHGVDIEGLIKTADGQIQTASSFGSIFGAIAQVLDALDDSHTFFVPPPRATSVEYGLVQQMIGDRCFVTNVRPGSSASGKLSPGDEVLSWEGYTPTRQLWPKLNYALSLQNRTVMNFVVRSPDGAQHDVRIEAKLREGKRVLDLTGNGDGDIWEVIRESENDERASRHRLANFRESLVVWKMPAFDLNDEALDQLVKQVRKYPALILDLRGNHGGYVKTLERLTGSTIDHDVTIGSRTGRKSGLKPIVGKTRGKDAFSGKLFVLIDSRSASAAELFARVVQLEHRGVVLGDRSSGRVMESRYYPFKQGVNTQIYYGASVTEADVVMSDGKSLEHAGVTPDELILVNAADLGAERDPVLARAASLAGMNLDPAEAGKLFPIEWRKD